MPPETPETPDPLHALSEKIKAWQEDPMGGYDQAIWEDVERAALNNAVLHRAVTLVYMGHVTREQALIAAVLELSRIQETQHKQLVELWACLPREGRKR